MMFLNIKMMFCSFWRVQSSVTSTSETFFTSVFRFTFTKLRISSSMFCQSRTMKNEHIYNIWYLFGCKNLPRTSIDCIDNCRTLITKTYRRLTWYVSTFLPISLDSLVILAINHVNLKHYYICLNCSCSFRPNFSRMR